MKPQVLELVKQLKSYYEEELKRAKEISIFLCGGSTAEQNKFRILLGKQISQITSKYTYSIHYPEDMFIEVISGHQARDLLTLENMLADSVDCILILLQSPGTFTELGAFSNHVRLCNKLIILIDKEFKGKRSFISLGPLRYLRYHTSSKILYSDISADNLPTLARQIVDAAREIPKQPIVSNYLANPISSLRFYLALVYTFEPLDKTLLFVILKQLAPGEKDIITVARTVTNKLASRQEISIDGNIMCMTPKGIDTLLCDNVTKKHSDYVSSYLSDIRLKALNLTMRK